MNEPKRVRIGWRRWMRYSLRTFLVVTVIVTIAVALTVNRYRSRKAAIEQIQAAGGTMGTEVSGPKWLRRLMNDDEYFYDPIRVSLGGITGREPSTEAKAIRDLLILIKQFDTITALDLRKSSVQDTDLAELREFSNLEVLRLSNTKVTDAGIKHLADMTNLQSIWLSNTLVTEAGVEELHAALPNCQIRH